MADQGLTDAPLAERLGLDGEYLESDLPLLIRREGMAELVDGSVRILDRRVLPHTIEYLECDTVEDVAVAIESMAIQGAFTLSLAAGYAMAMEAGSRRNGTTVGRRLADARRRLLATRPTGAALRRMLDAVYAVAVGSPDGASGPAAAGYVSGVAATLAKQALATGRHALDVLDGVDSILTHCFADRAFLYFLLEAKRRDREIHVYASETRPYLQGARLTAPSVQQIGHPVTLITDGMGGFLMTQGLVGAVVTAADRVCLDGTICNKIGTYQYAVAAAANELPYVVLRQSGPDAGSASAADVDVEYRDGEEVLHFDGRRQTAEGVAGLYPAFDITPPDLIYRIVTDRGAFLPENVSGYFDAPALPGLELSTSGRSADSLTP